MTRRIIILLFLLNFITGMLFINEGLFHHDSVRLAQAVEKTYKTGRLQPAVRGRYGLVVVNSLIYLPFFLLGQNADFATRFSSILFHSLSIVALFLLIKELFKEYNIAFFSSLLFSFTPFYFSPNTYGKEHGASIFFLLFSFFLLSRGISRKSPILLAVAPIIFVFSLTIRESLLATAPLFFLLYFSPQIGTRPYKIIFPPERLQPKLLFSFIFTFFAAFSFILSAYFKKAIYQAIFIQDTGSVNFLGPFSCILRSAVACLFFSMPVLVFMFFILGVFKMSARKDKFLTLFFFTWFMLIFYFGNLDIFVPRYLDVVVIPVYVLVSYVLSDLYTKERILAFVLLAYFVASMLILMYPLLKFRHGYNGQKRFALFVKEKTEENAVIIALDDGPFIEYYANRKTIAYPVAGQPQADSFAQGLRTYLKNGIPVYLMQSALIYDEKKLFENTLYKKFQVEAIGEKLTEDYHFPELRFTTYYEKLFKIENR